MLIRGDTQAKRKDGFIILLKSEALRAIALGDRRVGLGAWRKP